MLNHGISSGSRIRIRDAASRAEFENLDVQLEYGRSTGILELYRYRYGRGTGTAAAQQYSGTILNSFCCSRQNLNLVLKISEILRHRAPSPPPPPREMVGPNSSFTKVGKFIFKITFRSHGGQNIEL